MLITKRTPSTVLSWIQNLWSAPALEQVQIIEQREPSLEERLTRILSRSRGVKKQTGIELTELLDDVDAVLQILESAMNILDSRDFDERAKRLRTRLRKTRTRAQSARAA